MNKEKPPEEPEKTLCKNCKHKRSDGYPFSPNLWRCKAEESEKETYFSYASGRYKTKTVLKTLSWCENKNKGNCKDFERKRWIISRYLF